MALPTTPVGRARCVVVALAVAFVLAPIGCIKRDLRPIIPCVKSSVSKRIATTGVHEVDLLFVVDNSGSMAEEQAALKAQFPRLIEGLVTGDPDGDPGTPNFPPVASLRVAVVSSDLGVAGIQGLDTCSTNTRTAEQGLVGDNGVFNRAPVGAAFVGMPASCDGADPDSLPDTLDQSSLPGFLTFDAEGPVAGATFADRIGCYALLGTAGCGFEQQLESMLKSVTPSTSDVRFLAPAGSPVGAELGQGDRANGGWLRSDALLAVLMVTDEDDCSAENELAFNFRATGDYAENGTSLLSRVNTRCVRFGDEVVVGNPNGNDDLSKNTLHPPSRYAEGLIALKGGDANSVVFALITGVPPTSVDNPEHGEGTDNLDEILALEPMSVRFTPFGGDDFGRVAPSCTVCLYGANCDPGFNDLDGDTHDADDCVDSVVVNRECDPGEALNCTVENNGIPGCQIEETEVLAVTKAVPPRRLVRTARALRDLGAHVIVQSICQQDYSDSMTAILERISSGLASACLPRSLIRDGDDRVPCKVRETAPAGVTCASAPGRTFERMDASGREVCLVTQLPLNAEARATGGEPAGTGWYYDDFTEQRNVCPANPARQRISFTENAKPLGNVILDLLCDQPVAGDLDGPDMGQQCTVGGSSCAMTQAELDVFVVRYNMPGTYDGVAGPLFCEPRSNTCRVACTTDANCPGGYVCLEVEGGTSYCENPTCRG